MTAAKKRGYTQHEKESWNYRIAGCNWRTPYPEMFSLPSSVRPNYVRPNYVNA